MLLRAGELAKRTGLTVRALHHYDTIGLLCPTGRTDSGYRLYSRDDVARLHGIQTLRRMGLSLADAAQFEVDPISRTPHPHGRRSPTWPPRSPRIRRSSANR